MSRGTFGALGLALLCLLMAANAWKHIAKGDLLYTNYTGLPVFAPFAAAIGGLGVWAAFVLWKKYARKQP